MVLISTHFIIIMGLLHIILMFTGTGAITITQTDNRTDLS